MTSLLVIAVVSAIVVGVGVIQQVAYASTIEVPTYDPPMSGEGIVNGTRILDYDPLFEGGTTKTSIQWANNTVLISVPQYLECANRPASEYVTSLNNETAKEHYESLSSDMQKATRLDSCVAEQYFEKMIRDMFK